MHAILPCSTARFIVSRRLPFVLMCFSWLMLLPFPGFTAQAAKEARSGRRPAAAATAPKQAAPTQAVPATTPAETPPVPARVPPAQQPVRPDAAFAVVAAEAEKGNGNAMLTLGHFYEQGFGTLRNYTKTVEWYEKAAKAGQPEAYYNLGICFEIGMGVAADSEKALQNYRKAADLGLALAMYKLAFVSFSGVGGGKDTAKGVEYLEKAASAGMSAAANDLGTILLSGLAGQSKDEAKALAMFKKAAILGNFEAMKNMAAMHRDGMGVKADFVAAFTWYCIARRCGYAGEDITRIMGFLENSLSAAQVQQARKEAEGWVTYYANPQAGGQ